MEKEPTIVNLNLEQREGYLYTVRKDLREQVNFSQSNDFQVYRNPSMKTHAEKFVFSISTSI